ncbi:MAG: ribonuclease P protein component [Bdellovibrionota bacterium]|nr:MAG: ribonuclease P protein component [Bdellovibrionota bacterium]
MSDQCLPKASRLLRHAEFSNVHDHGKKWATRLLVVYVAPSTLQTSRLGLTVSRKVDKRAVVRNRIKRRIREVFRMHRAMFLGNFDIVVVARQNAATAEYKALKNDILMAWRRLSVLAK